MKKTVILFILSLFLPLIVFSQTTDPRSIMDGIDFISPYNDGFAAINKGNEWTFIDHEGNVIMDFREDLVLSDFDNLKYPVFNNNRCLVSKEKEGITYYGYIDSTGHTVIEPEFLNAANFNNNVAIVLELRRRVLGTNDIFKKEQVLYNYFQVLINNKGEVMHYLTEEPTRITLDKDFIKQTPKITSKLISDKVFAVRTKDKKWEIKKLK